MPRRPAIAVRCTTALVEPPSAISMRNAFSTDCVVMIVEGVIGCCVRRTATRPDASAATSRCESTAGIAAVPGNAIPKASVMQAIVLAVPMTAQVPAVTASLPSISSSSALATSPVRNFAQKRRQSVHAPRRSP